MNSCSKSKVSVIIPCYNAERWIGEAIESCLAQTYRPIEIIVVDDGSTDDSIKIVKQYGEKVTLETGPNLGGNHARNRGFELSSGDYIQYLDADDFILPEKIERQIRVLEETGADVVYGDWRHQTHFSNDTVVIDEVNVSGHQQDVLESLLSGWWVALHSIIYKRKTVLETGGWSEIIMAGQDKYFFISVALSGAKIVYSPGCFSIYRRYGDVTVSTGNTERWLDNHYRVLLNIEEQIHNRGLDEKYLLALAKGYFYIGRNYFAINRKIYLDCINKVKKLDPNFRPHERNLYNFTQRLFGFYIADLLALMKRKFI